MLGHWKAAYDQWVETERAALNLTQGGERPPSPAETLQPWERPPNPSHPPQADSLPIKDPLPSSVPHNQTAPSANSPDDAQGTGHLSDGNPPMATSLAMQVVSSDDSTDDQEETPLASPAVADAPPPSIPGQESNILLEDGEFPPSPNPGPGNKPPPVSQNPHAIEHAGVNQTGQP
jgi:hypothetical protein